MSSPTILPNLAAGNKGAVDLGLHNMGVKPVGNGAGSNLPGPSGLGSGTKIIPVTTAPTSLNPANNPGVLPSGTTGIPVTTGTYGSALSDPNNPSTAGANAATGSELKNVFGSGVGGLIGSEISNLGSSDSSYIEAYKRAMAGANAENLATLQTTLDNEGVSANSSTAAIAQGDFESNVSAEEGLQVQQLQMNDLAQLLGLTESLEGPAQAAQQDTLLNVLGKVAGDVGSSVAGAAAGKFI